MSISKTYLPRRAVLRGIGATLALPLLDGVVPALTALSQAAGHRFDGPLFDCHSHLFPTAEKQAPFLRFIHQERALHGKVLLSDALVYMKEAGVSRLNHMLLYPSGTLFHEAIKDLPPTQEGREKAAEARQRIVADLIAHNEWGIDTVKDHPQLSCFLGLDPVLMDEKAMLTELEDKLRKGAKGLKLAPIDYGIPFDDRRHWPLWDYCQAHNVPIFVYSGSGYIMYQARLEQPAHPRAFYHALEEFPRLRLCTAHLSSGAEDVWIDLQEKYRGLYAETAGQLTREDPVTVIRRFGTDRVVFGINFGTTTEEASYQNVERFRRLPLTPREHEMIAGKNFEGFISR